MGPRDSCGVRAFRVRRFTELPVIRGQGALLGEIQWIVNIANAVSQFVECSAVPLATVYEF